MDRVTYYPTKVIYQWINHNRSAEEFTAATIAIAFFSGLGAYHSTKVFTFSVIPSILLLNQLRIIEQNDNDRFRAIAFCRGIIGGACIGYLLHYDHFQCDRSFFVPSWTTPFHLLNFYLTIRWIFNNEHYSLGRMSPSRLLAYYIFPEDPDLKPHKIVYVAIIVISAIAAYVVPYLHTFSIPVTFTLFMGALGTGRATENSLDRVILAVSLMILGTSVGKTLSHAPRYSWKTPIHTLNNCVGLFLLGLSHLKTNWDFSDYSPIDLSNLEFTPIQIKQKNKDENFEALKVRVEELKKRNFKFDIKFKEKEDQILAAYYILLADKDWSRQEKKKNYMALALCSHADKNPGIDPQYARWVLDAAKILGAN